MFSLPLWLAVYSTLVFYINLRWLQRTWKRPIFTNMYESASSPWDLKETLFNSNAVLSKTEAPSIIKEPDISTLCFSCDWKPTLWAEPLPLGEMGGQSTENHGINITFECNPMVEWLHPQHAPDCQTWVLPHYESLGMHFGHDRFPNKQWEM